MPRTTAAAPKPYGLVSAPSGGSTKKAESAYPPPRDRRLSRKTRATVGKPPGTANAVSAVRTSGIALRVQCIGRTECGKEGERVMPRGGGAHFTEAINRAMTWKNLT